MTACGESYGEHPPRWLNCAVERELGEHQKIVIMHLIKHQDDEYYACSCLFLSARGLSSAPPIPSEVWPLGSVDLVWRIW